ncbi:MAG TPA: HEAT repeat domain-containing protein, partial [Bryobacteraceae bacterium]|nr:HEAT repeat domain-containing protein [Bryobacteraceae bacterium]
MDLLKSFFHPLALVASASLMFAQDPPPPPEAPEPPEVLAAQPAPPAPGVDAFLSHRDSARAVERAMRDAERELRDVERKFEFEFKGNHDLWNAVEHLKELRIDTEHFKDFKLEMEKLKDFKVEVEGVKDFNFHFENGPWLSAQSVPQPPQPPSPTPWPKVATSISSNRLARGSEENLYRSGTSALDRREWAEAVDYFDAAASRKGAKADGALHWKAYALHKLGRRDEALAAVVDLNKSYPSSRWLDDAKALEVEIRQASGRPMAPEQQSDEDLKLMAINALIGSDPERAVPLLEKLLERTSSPRLKERAVFVLAQSPSPQAQGIVANFARGRKGNPDLQLKAVEYLSARGKETLPILDEVYGSTADFNIKRRIIQGYMNGKDTDRLLKVARSESNTDLRGEAIERLGHLKAETYLAQLWASEQDPALRGKVMEAFHHMGAFDPLLEAARTEKDPKLRRTAIHWLSNMRRSPAVSDALVGMYGNEADQQTKREILRSLYERNEPAKLVDVARRENDPGLKREAVR